MENVCAGEVSIFFLYFLELKFVWFLYIDTNENKMYNLPTAKFVIIGFGTFINKLTFSTDIIYHMYIYIIHPYPYNKSCTR